MKLKVKSYNLTSYLERTFVFEPPLKKYGEIKHIENIGFNGGDYSAKIFSENGSEILDKEVCDSVEMAISEFKKENPLKPATCRALSKTGGR